MKDARQSAPTVAVNIMIGGDLASSIRPAEAPTKGRSGIADALRADVSEPARYWLILTVTIALNVFGCLAFTFNIFVSIFVYALSFVLFVACVSRTKPRE